MPTVGVQTLTRVCGADDSQPSANVSAVCVDTNAVTKIDREKGEKRKDITCTTNVLISSLNSEKNVCSRCGLLTRFTSLPDRW